MIKYESCLMRAAIASKTSMDERSERKIQILKKMKKVLDRQKEVL